MQAVTYPVFRDHLREYLDKVIDDAEPILVTREDSCTNVVVLSARDYENMLENLRIRSNPYLMKKIERGIGQFAASDFAARDQREA